MALSRRHSRANSGARVEAVPEPLIPAGPEVEEFANSLDDCLSPRLSPDEKRQRLLDLPRKYYEKTIAQLAKQRQTGPRHGTHDDMDMYPDELVPAATETTEHTSQLENEAQTWDLLRRVLPLRYDSKGSQEHVTPFGRLSTDNISERFFLSSSVAQERRAVLQWLQKNRSEGPNIDSMTKELQRNADRGDIIAYGWLHTRSAIKQKKRATGWSGLLERQSTSIERSHTNSNGAPLITQLDPDSMTRQAKKLEPQDEYFERAIWLGCLEHLRRGSDLKALRHWCTERTELWRAISMSAMLFPLEGEEVTADVDPTALALWRRMCYGLAKHGGADDYERAVYGLLSGDIISLEKVSQSWEDHLFAHYNALLRTQFDNFVLSHCPPDVATSIDQSFPSFDAIHFHGAEGKVEQRLIRSLEANPSLQAEALQPTKTLQAAFIASEMDDYLYHQGIAVSPDDPGPFLRVARTMALQKLDREGPSLERYFTAENHAGLRMVTHIYILITLLEQTNEEKALFTTFSERQLTKEHILAAYVDFLRRAGLQELIPLYCSIFESSKRYEVLSSALILEEDESRRLTQLKLMKSAGIDVIKFVETQAQMLYERLGSNKDDKFEAKTSFQILEESPSGLSQSRILKSDFFADDESEVDPKHDHLIRSLEWLLLVSEKWHEVFAMGVLSYKYFLRHLHLNAARTLLKRVPFAAVMRQVGVDDDMDEATYESVEFWSELCEEYSSTTSQAEILRVKGNARTFRQLEALVKALDSLETIGSYVVISADAPVGDREFWKEIGDETETATKNMQPLLKGWLKGPIEDGDKELQTLREAYLPETVLAYVSALQFAGTGLSRDYLLECMDLAARIVEHDSDLQPLFVEQKRIRELLGMFAAASKALAVQTTDKRSLGSNGKRMREMGWSRDIWSVKS